VIQNLLQQIAAALLQHFPSDFSQPQAQILTRPGDNLPPGVRPVIAMYPGKLDVSQHYKESAPNQPHPQVHRQEIPLASAAPAGPYTLERVPLPGAMDVQLIYAKDALEEHRVPLVVDKDYTLHITSTDTVTITLSQALQNRLAGATHLLLRYPYVGAPTLMYTEREFTQVLYLDVHDDTVGAVERWTSLLCGMLTAEHDTLVTTASAVEDQPTYQAGSFATQHLFDHLLILEGHPVYAQSTPCFQLRCQVAGRLRLMQEAPDGLHLIRQIISPGRRTSARAVDIDAIVR
jgi:hypothetical protein